MVGWLPTFLAALSSLLKSRVNLQLENVALRHQIGVLQRSVYRPRLEAPDRWFWVFVHPVNSELLAMMRVAEHP